MQLKEYLASNGDLLLYTGDPDLSRLNGLARGPGDLWHSSLDRGYCNAFHEIVYQTHIAWWYVEDFQGVDSCVNWRVDPSGFVVRKRVWEHFGGFNPSYRSTTMAAFSMGYNMIKYGAVPMYCKGLFPEIVGHVHTISISDKFQFFIRKFRWPHALYMLLRAGLLNPVWYFHFIKALCFFRRELIKRYVREHELDGIKGSPKISYIIPTMMRQRMVRDLLDDLAVQSYLPHEVIIVDSTPFNQRINDLYYERTFPFELKVIWSEIKGSCYQRNIAIDHSCGDFIIFSDDDLRIPATHIHSHVSFLQCFGLDACTGPVINADKPDRDLTYFASVRQSFVSINCDAIFVASKFSNANSCVTRKVIDSVKLNDVNFDGGYGEDSDYGLRCSKNGFVVFENPHSLCLHLKPPSGGYRYWESLNKTGFKELLTAPISFLKRLVVVNPKPSPTIMYFAIKHFSLFAVSEYMIKNILSYVFSDKKYLIPFRVLKLPYRILQLRVSINMAKLLKYNN